MDLEKSVEKRSSERRPLKTKIKFYFDSDIVEATSVDISDNGIRFDTEAPVQVFLRLSTDGGPREHLAKFVWARSKSDGGMTYGLEYVPESEERLLADSERI